MSPPTESTPEQDAVRGRTDGPDQLSARLSLAGLPYLRAALENPALGPTQVLFLLRNRSADRQVLERVTNDRRFGGLRAVRVGLASHPELPRPEAVRILGILGWRDVVRVVENPRTPPVVKRQGAIMLRERLEGLSLGEKLTLARLAPRELLPDLLRDARGRVVRALLDNPRLTEPDVVRMARGAGAARDTLSVIARSDKWGSFPAVRWAVIENPATPVSDALHCVRRMSLEDRRRAAEHPGLPRLVRVGARRTLAHPAP